MSQHKICLLPGDGIGAEVIDCAVRVIGTLADHDGPRFVFDTQPAGHGTFLETGHSLPNTTLEAAKAADAVLLGAMDVAEIPPHGGDPLGGLRIGLEVSASIRPSLTTPGVASPAGDIDCVIVREVTEGLYARD